MKLFVNSEPREIRDGWGIVELITHLGLPPQGALVEHNGHALFRADWEKTRLADGDRLEILRVVAGG